MIRYKWTKPGTCWWSNDWNPKHVTNMREDKLLTFSRSYSRKYRKYFYSLVIGRLAIRFF